MRRNPIIYLAALAFACVVIVALGVGDGRLASIAAAAAPDGCLPWQVVPSPNVQTLESHLTSVSAVDANDIWAVGYYFNDNLYPQTLTEHWNGTAWTIIDSPNPGTARNLLFGVAAISANNAWAVGWQANTNIPQPLILHWDGMNWSESVVSFQRPQVRFLGISAISANDIWAVGLSCETAICMRRITAAAHYDGTSWTIFDSLNPGGFDNTFYGVKARAANDVWAVGDACTENGCAASQSLIEHWDGSTWTVSNSPNPGSVQNILIGVDAVAPGDAWAVGQECADAGCTSSRSLTLHWNGSAWNQESSPNPGTMDTHLNAVVMAASNDVWAVGSETSDGSTYTNPVLHWDGSAWTVVTVTNPGSVDNNLYGLAKVTPTDVWAVGDFQNSGSNYETQVQHYTGPCGGTPTVTVTPPSTATATSTATTVSTSTATSVPPTASATSTPVPSTTPCPPANFTDVHSTDYFYEAVNYLYCHGAISGYSDDTFRPYNTTTRGQLSKIVVLAEGWAIDTSGGPHFSDVQTSNPFYDYIETAYNHSIISGYADGTFRWGNNVTRAQLTKIIVLAEGWAIDTTGGPHFSDVPASDAFYTYVETAFNHSIISGYADGTFRPGNSATRGQIAKIVYNAVTGP